MRDFNLYFYKIIIRVNKETRELSWEGGRNIEVRQDPEGKGRSHGGVAETDEDVAEAINLWGTILRCGEIFLQQSSQ